MVGSRRLCHLVLILREEGRPSHDFSYFFHAFEMKSTVCKINPRPLATVAAGVLPVFAWRSCRVESTRRAWCASFSRSFRSNYMKRQMSDCRACWICGRSVLGVRIYDAVPELCRLVDIWHGSRTLRYGLWRSWGRSAWSTGWGDSFKVFFLSFSCLPMHLCVCLSLPPVFWSMQAHLPDLRQETGPTHDVAYQKETKNSL